MKNEDLFCALDGVSDELLLRSMKKPRRRRAWTIAAAGVAACLCLLAAGRIFRQPQKLTAQPQASDAQLAAPDNRQETDELPQTQLVALEELPRLQFAEVSGEFLTTMDISFPNGWFIRTPDADAIAGIWGMTADTLQWEGFDASACALQGEIIYDGAGKVWKIHLSGAYAGGSFTIQLAPEHMPANCLTVEPTTRSEVHGTAVAASHYSGGNGENYCVEFLRGSGETAVGVRIEAQWPTETAAAEELLTRLVSQSLRQEGTLSVAQFHTDDVPEWRAEALTEAQARAETGFGQYLPQTLPAGFRFRSAWRELGEGRDYLSIDYETNSYDYLWLTVDKCADLATLVSADELARYDRRPYFGADAENAPEEYWDTIDRAIFRAEELSWDVIAARTTQSDDRAYYASFGVLYPDGTVVQVTAHAEEAALHELLEFLLP